MWQLSLEVREWKFLSRCLDLEEEIVDGIDYNTRPNKTRDKALKVFTELWVNSSTPTWETLEKALLHMPPVEVKTNGVKILCLMALTQ